jgi:uncharacterized protein (TIGR02001 family)
MQAIKTLSLVAALAAAMAAQSPVAPAPAAPPVPPPPPAILGFTLTGSTTLGSQYIFRGLTQTDGKPTIQGELDLVHPSGFYLSTSLSNISWFTDQNAGFASAKTSLGSPAAVGAPYLLGKVNSASVELDLFGGYKWGFVKDWALDLGLYRYLYPGTYDNLGAYRNPATTEAYLGLSYAWASLKYSQVISANTFGVNNSGGTTYVDLSLAIPLGESGWTVLAHGGKTTYSTKANPGYFFNGSTLTGDNTLFSYTDYRLGIAKEIKGYTLTLAGTKADTKSRAADNDVTVYENALGRNIGGDRVTFTIGKAF